ncbi:MAG: NUDIX domain-containing protein [Methanobacteriota archaeon]|nr:MAG: NUDIX domain-containing protein [Euryarchaeota archaeon]
MVSARNEFPQRPVPAVGALVFRDGAVLLVKRGAEPNRDRWSLPGGALETGETVEAAVVREIREETGVDVRPLRVLDVRDFIERKDSRVRWHYVLIDVLCEYVRGDPFPATDAENARLIPLRELGEYDVVPTALEVIQMTSARRIGSGETASR